MLYPVKGVFEISEDMVQILLMLEIFFTQDSEYENLFCVHLPALNPACSSTAILSAWGLNLFKRTFSMTLLV